MSSYFSDDEILPPYGGDVGVSYSPWQELIRLDVGEQQANRRVETSAYLEPDYARAVIQALTWALEKLSQPTPAAATPAPHCAVCGERIGEKTDWHDIRPRPDSPPQWVAGQTHRLHLGPGPYDHPAMTAAEKAT